MRQLSQHPLRSRFAWLAAGLVTARGHECRTATFQLTRGGDTAGGDGEGVRIEGYGAVFGSVTRIAGWEGTFDEKIAPGAFSNSLRRQTPKMQYDHGNHPLLGSLPIGRWDVVEEDSRGLHVVGTLSDNWLVQPFRDAIRSGAVSGMSFRFSVDRESWADANGRPVSGSELSRLLWDAGERGPLLRTLLEVELSEVGPVTWPAYEATSVGVRVSAATEMKARMRQVRQRAAAADASSRVLAARGRR